MHARTLLVLALGTLGAGAIAGSRRWRRRAQAPAAAPAPLRTWEEEGGGVPVDTHRTASQVSPHDVPTLRDEA